MATKKQIAVAAKAIGCKVDELEHEIRWYGVPTAVANLICSHHRVTRGAIRYYDAPEYGEDCCTEEVTVVSVSVWDAGWDDAELGDDEALDPVTIKQYIDWMEKLQDYQYELGELHIYDDIEEEYGLSIYGRNGEELLDLWRHKLQAVRARYEQERRKRGNELYVSDEV